MAGFLLMFVWMAPLFGDSSEDGANIDFDGSLRVLFLPDTGQIDPYLEVQAHAPADDGFLGYSAVTAGAYYRVLENAKLGLFYRLQFGALHEEDWVWANGAWSWADTSSRAESVLIGDFSPRFLLPGLPGENWVLSLKNRYEYNLYNNHQGLYIRPGLTYYHMSERELKFSLGMHYGAGIAFNFGDEIFYSHQLYVQGSYVLSDPLALQLEAGWNRHNYSGESAGRSFDFSENSISAELSLVIQPRL